MPFVPIERYPEFKLLQSNAQAIAEESKKVDDASWRQWASDARGPDDKAIFLSKGGDWTIFPVFFGTQKAINRHPFLMNLPPEMINAIIENMKSLFPKTTSVLRPLKRINFAAFSRLKPNSDLSPHSHDNIGALILHLGLIIPPGGTAGLKVGNDVHLWQRTGDMIIFNDHNIHSAWNKSDQERIIFYVDFNCDDPNEGLE